MWQDNFIQLDDIRLHYWRAGAGRPVIMLHGVSDDGRCWGRTGDALAQEFDVILVDQRAHGQSSAPETGYRLDDFASDIHGLIKALHLKDVILVGHSLGASVSLRTASQYPDLISRVVLIDPPMPDSPQNTDPDVRYEWFGWLRNFQNQSIEKLIEHHTTPNWSENEIRAMAESKHRVRSVLWEKHGAILDTHWRYEMKKVGDMPILLIYGELAQGSAVSPENANEAVSILQNGKAVHIKGAGHIVHLDQFEATIAAMMPFLSE